MLRPPADLMPMFRPGGRTDRGKGGPILFSNTYGNAGPALTDGRRDDSLIQIFRKAACGEGSWKAEDTKFVHWRRAEEDRFDRRFPTVI